MEKPIIREFKGIEASTSQSVELDKRSQYYIFPVDTMDLEPGDEILVLVEQEPLLEKESYGIVFRITSKSTPDEDEFVLQYGDKVLVAQKMPDFI